MTFNPTHGFRGLELEFIYDIGEELGYYRAESGGHFYIPKKLVTKIQPKPRPKPGEVWRLSKNGPGPLRGVDALGRLFSIDLQTVVWDPDRHHEKFLAQYTKVLNADGTPARSA